MQYNDKVDVVSSQHAAYNTQQKALGKDNFIAIPPGVSPAIIIIIMIIIIIILFTETILILDMMMIISDNWSGRASFASLAEGSQLGQDEQVKVLSK